MFQLRQDHVNFVLLGRLTKKGIKMKTLACPLKFYLFRNRFALANVKKTCKANTIKNVHKNTLRKLNYLDLNVY